MKLIRGLINLEIQLNQCVATIGNFDGVHIGHQAIIQKVIKQAKQFQVESCVILFEPHPKEFFMGEDCPARVTRFSEKYKQLKNWGVNKLLVLRFNKALSQMQAFEFIETILIEKLKIKHLVVGDDFQFGFKRQGNFQLLKEKGEQLSAAKKIGAYTVEPTPTLYVSGLNDLEQRASSTLVRDSLINNDLKLVSKLLGRQYFISGKVGYGRQLGRTIGFPTANISLNRKKLALSGVYLVKAFWDDSELSDKQSFWGVANCGFRPTVNGKNYKCEVHLLGVSSDLYGIELQIEFHSFLRGEIKFDGITALTDQIKQDVIKAKELITEIIEK